MPNAPKGYSGAVLEAGTSLGLYQLLNPTAISALPVSLTNAIPAAATTGMHILVRAYNHTASGTITLTGTAPNSLAVAAETTTTLPVLESPGQYADYTTAAIFGAINSSGVTLGSGLTGGTIVLFGIQAAKRLIVGELKLTDKRKDYPVVQQRGTLAESHMAALAESWDPEWDYSCDFMPDNCMWIVQAGINSAPSSTNLPSVGVAVLASTSIVSASNASAATQPTAPGMILQCVIAGTPTTAATVSITGTNLYGETITEVVVPSTKTNGTYQSQNVFASVAASGIVWGAFGAGTLTVNGFFGFQLTAQTADTLSSVAFYQYDSEGNYVAPYGLCNEWSLDIGIEKEAKVTAKGICQAICLVGNTNSNSQQGPTFAQPQDEAVTGWRTQVWIDGISGTPGTTQQLDVQEVKIVCQNPWKQLHTSWGNPPVLYWNRAYRGRRKIAIEMKLDMAIGTYNTEMQAFKRGTKRLTQWQILGLPALGTVSGTTYTPGWTITAPVRWVEDPQRTFQLSQENVELTLKGMAYYDSGLGYDLQVVPNTRIASW